MATSPNSEWEACGVDEWWNESVEDKVDNEVTEYSDGTSGVKEGETSCANDNSATAGIND